jgi:hypothetical protein
VIGKQINVLVNNNLNAGTYKADWDGSMYGSGIYFYTLTTEGFTQTKKMILVK